MQAQRERQALPWLENLGRDLRYAFARLAKHPAVTAVAVLSIATWNRRQCNDLCDGEPVCTATGAGRRSVDAACRFISRERGEPCCNEFPLPVYEDLRDQAKSFSGVAAYYELIPASISGGGEPERVWGQAVTTNFFDVLELPMVLGRGFAERRGSASRGRNEREALAAAVWKRSADCGQEHHALGTVIHGGRRCTGIVPQRRSDSGHAILGSARHRIATCAQPASAGLARVSLARRGGAAAAWRDTHPGSSELDTMAHRFAVAYPKTDKDNSFVFEQAGSLPPRERTAVLTFLAAL